MGQRLICFIPIRCCIWSASPDTVELHLSVSSRCNSQAAAALKSSVLNRSESGTDQQLLQCGSGRLCRATAISPDFLQNPLSSLQVSHSKHNMRALSSKKLSHLPTWEIWIVT